MRKAEHGDLREAFGEILRGGAGHGFTEIPVDHRARRVGLQRTAQTGRDPGGFHRREGVGVQDARAGLGQQAHLTIADAGDGPRVRHDGGIRAHQPRHVRPVLIDVRADARRRQRAGHVRAVAGQGVDLPLTVRAIEAGDDQPGHAAHPGEAAQRGGNIQRAGFVKAHEPCGVHHRHAAPAGKEPGTEGLAPAQGVGFGDFKRRFDLPRDLARRKTDAQFPGDPGVAGRDCVDQRRGIPARGPRLPAAIQQCGDLFPALLGRPRCGQHDAAPFGRGAHNLQDLPEPPGGGGGAAAEFGRDELHGGFPQRQKCGAGRMASNNRGERVSVKTLQPRSRAPPPADRASYARGKDRVTIRMCSVMYIKN